MIHKINCEPDLMRPCEDGREECAELAAEILPLPFRKTTRYTDPKTGGQKDAKIEQLGAVDPLALLELAAVAGDGAIKYSRGNYIRGYPWSLGFDAMMRHALAFWSGEDRDPESGHLHAAHAAWHALALVTFLLREVETDDRPPKVAS